MNLKSELDLWRDQRSRNWIVTNGVGFAIAALAWSEAADFFDGALLFLGVIPAGVIGITQGLFLIRYLGKFWWIWPLALLLTGEIALGLAVWCSIMVVVLFHFPFLSNVLEWSLLAIFSGLLMGAITGLPQTLLLRPQVKPLQWLGASLVGQSIGWLVSAIALSALCGMGLATLDGQQFPLATALSWLWTGGVIGLVYGWSTAKVLPKP